MESYATLMDGYETDCATVFGMTGKNLNEKEKILFDWVLTTTMLMLGVALVWVDGQLHTYEVSFHSKTK